MPQYMVTSPDGKQYKITAPEGTTQEQALEHFKSQMSGPPSLAPKEDPSNLGPLANTLDPGPFIKGIGQGIIGIPEAIYQYGEHLPAPLTFPRPDKLPVIGPYAEPLRKYQRDVESTKTGVGGEVVGNVLGFMGGGELADLLRVPGLLAKAGASPAARTELSTLLQSQIAEPSQGDSFWTDKLSSGVLAHLFGRWLGRPTQQAQRNIATTTNKGIADLNQKDLDAFRQQQAASKQAAANALSDPNHPINLALNARQARIDAKAAVPADTTSGWWHRTLQQIGVTDPALARAAPSTGAKVRDVVGGRRNEIIGRMELNSSDPNFTEQIHDIRDATMRDLPESAQNKFYKEPPEEDLPGLIINPVTGKPFARTTRGLTDKEPPKPTGDWMKTVEEPLAKGNLTKRELSDYISRLGARAEELAKLARLVPQDQRAEMYAMSNAYRQVADAVVGHAAGSPEDKLALEAANKAYMMWSAGNDAALASRNGEATPRQLIESLKRRLGGEARYEQALNNPQSPYHDTVNWLQDQLKAHTEKIPSAADTRRGVPPTPGAAPPTPPTPREMVPVPEAPNRPARSVITPAATSAAAWALGHPWIATAESLRALHNLLRPGSGGKEKFVERGVRALLENFPRTAGRVATPIAGTAAGQIPRTVVPQKEREGAGRIGQAAADALGNVTKDMYYRWTTP